MSTIEPRHLVVDVAAGSPTLTGLWCPTCAAPSGVEVPVLSLTPDGVTIIGTARVCADADDPAAHRLAD